MQQLTLSARLALGFAMIFFVVALLLGFILLRVNTLRSLSDNLGRELVPTLIASQELTSEVGGALDCISSYAISGRPDYLERWNTRYQAVETTGRGLMSDLGHQHVLSGLRPRVESILGDMKNLQRNMEELEAATKSQQAAQEELARISLDSRTLLQPLTAEFGSRENRRRQALEAMGLIQERLALLWEAYARPGASGLDGNWPAGPPAYASLEPTTKEQLDKIFARLEDRKKDLIALGARKSEVQAILVKGGEQILAALGGFNQEARDLTGRVMGESETAGRQINRSMIVGLLVALGLTVGLVLILIRSTVRPLGGVIRHFDQGASEVTQTADHLSRSSRLLAQGVSENTAAVLEAISSLEEMLSMAKRNAGHSTQAKDLMVAAKGYVLQANEAMSQISTAMEEILESSQAGSQIIKTVEEIAFQTNILALNAAVEAARAGEAGVGFAVVADEVRNLANRSAEAAKSTAVILAGSMDRINQGSRLVSDAEENFSSMVAATDQMEGIVGEIAQASQSQAQDIQNIHQSIALMDKVTQENAAGAGETQSLSDNLTRQAALLSEALGEMIMILKGSAQAGGRPRPSARTAAAAAPGSFQLREHLQPPRAAADRRPSRPAVVVDSRKKSKLEEAIPMDDDDF